MLQNIITLVSRITANLLGTKFEFIVSHDLKSGNRVFIQVMYKAICTNTGDPVVWKGRKYYLSSHMTNDEVVKTCFVAFRAAVEHEVMEGFKVDDIILFNPHVNFEELLSISHKEIKREESLI